ncbi:hypothetical protein ACFQ3Z_42440 [Streptomyces nogalater]
MCSSITIALFRRDTLVSTYFAPVASWESIACTRRSMPRPEMPLPGVTAACQMKNVSGASGRR